MVVEGADLRVCQNIAIATSPCINPSGKSSVARNQFESDRNNYDLQFSRIGAWLKRETELREQICL
jgi:cyanosortase A-associated protein